MEHLTKFLGLYLGVCCVLMVATSNSTVKFYTPHQYMRRISTLLSMMEKILKDQVVGNDVTVKTPQKKPMQGRNDCVGTFLDMFQDGNTLIGNKISAIHNLSLKIDDCVCVYKRDCTALKKSYNRTCEDLTRDQEVSVFVNKFQEFSNTTALAFNCRKRSNQREKYEEDSEGIPICGI